MMVLITVTINSFTDLAIIDSLNGALLLIASLMYNVVTINRFT